MPDLSGHKILPKHTDLGITCQTSQGTKFYLSTQTCVQARYMLACLGSYISQIGAYMYRPISQPNWVISETSRYLWNQENILDLSEHI